MVRLFAGLGLPVRVCERLVAARSAIPGARWIDPDNLHLTLRFFGEVTHDVADDIDLELGRIDVAPFQITIQGVGHFEKKLQPTAVWAAVEPNDGLARLAAKTETAARRAGLAPEPRKFVPHVTLARLKRPPVHRVESFLRNRADLHVGPIEVSAFHLFSSHLGRDRADYTREAEYRLRG